MAYKLIWSPAGRDDHHDILVFIARDNPNRAMSFGYELISDTDCVEEFPELHSSLRSKNNLPNIFIAVFRHDATYRVNHDVNLCEIARVWHSVRGLPQV
jgi:plasmid stabilization system protein ParE